MPAESTDPSEGADEKHPYTALMRRVRALRDHPHARMDDAVWQRYVHDTISQKTLDNPGRPEQE